MNGLNGLIVDTAHLGTKRLLRFERPDHDFENNDLTVSDKLDDVDALENFAVELRSIRARHGAHHRSELAMIFEIFERGGRHV